MVGHRGLTETDRVDEVAQAGLLIVVCGDKGHQLEPGRVGHGFECAGEVLGVVAAQRRNGQRRAAGVRSDVWVGVCKAHTTIMPTY